MGEEYSGKEMNEIQKELANLNPQELEELEKYSELLGKGQPLSPEQINRYTLLKNIIERDDTSKVGNIDDDETFAVRSLQNVSLLVGILDYPVVSDYWKRKSEIILATSLSKKISLINAAITEKKSYSTSERKEERRRKGWIFSRKDNQEQPQEQS